MIFPTEMETVQVGFLSEDRERVMDALQRKGVVEIKEADGLPRELKNVDVDFGTLSSLQLRSDKLLNEMPAAEGSSLISSILGKPESENIRIKSVDIGDLIRKSERVIEFAERENSRIGENIKSAEKASGDLKGQVKILADIKGYDFDLAVLKGLRETFCFAGRLARNQRDDVSVELKREGTFFHFTETGNESYWVLLVLGLKGREDEVRGMLAKRSFELFDLKGFRGVPSEMIRDRENRISMLEKRIGYERKRLSEFSEKWFREIESTNRIIRSFKERSRSLNLLKETRYVTFLEGFVPKRNKYEVANALSRIADERIFVDFERAKNPPTELRNPGFVKRFEMLTEGFGLPKQRDVDPTVFVSFFFPVMFGLMLGDMFYGMLILGVAFGMRRYVKNDVTRVFSVILTLCGISAIVWGALFGSFFGGFLSMSPLLSFGRDPVSLLVFSLAFGLVHINLGLGLSVIQRIRRREKPFQEISWFLVEIGGVAVVLEFFGLTAGLLYPSLAVFLSGVMIKMKNPVNAIGIFSFSGNIFSYVRLAAIGLTTAYIALLVNHMTLVALSSSFAFACVIFIGGHIFNCTISSVGALINSLRLHYVEFFSQFYSGNGRKFSPLKYEGVEIIN